MKVKRLLPIIFLSISGLSLTGCSLVDRMSEVFKIRSNEVKTEAILPNDREQILLNNTAKEFAPEEFSNGEIRGDWAIETVSGKEAVGETVPFLKFSPEENRVYGSNGCNVIHASYKNNPADSTIRFSSIASTMMACAKQGITDIEINLALDATRYYDWELKDCEYYLYFYDADHRRIMSLLHQNFHFLDGTWKVVAIDDEPVNVKDMKFVIDTAEGKLHGNTGCNIFNGKMELDMETPNSISFQAIGMTRRACPDQNYETRLIVALEDACRAKPISQDRVVLINSQGKPVIQLQRTTDK